MTENRNYIQKIEITDFWGKFHIEWNLNPDVNILAGINGSGKSTLLNAINFILGNNINEKRAFFTEGSVVFRHGKTYFVKKGNRTLNPQNLNALFSKTRFYFINSFEKELKSAENIQKLSNETVKTDLDWEIYQLQKKYLDYQLNISKKKDIAVEKSENPKEEIAKIRFPQLRFWEMLDELFGETNKKVNRDKNEIAFLLEETKEIQAHQLSSGEKQLLVILLTVLIQDNKSSILFMDEPEVSLHIEWQKKLIGFIRELNPNVQIIIATHSPAIIMNGWLDKVFNMSDIMFRNKELVQK